MGSLRIEVALLATLACVGMTPDAGARPSIVVIRTDDQPAGAPLPQVRDLVQAAGITFTESFVSLATCAPSRATFLTGRYAHNTGVWRNVPPRGGYEAFEDESALPVWLASAGYRTLHVGKYLNEYRASHPVPPGWSRWFTLGTGIGYYGYQVNEDGREKRYDSRPDDYLTDVLTDKAVAYIRAESKSDRPFFLLLDYFAPHSSGEEGAQGLPVPAPRHLGKLADHASPRPPSFNEQDVNDKPRGIRNLPLLSPEEIDGVTERRRRTLETLMSVDEGVARVVKALERAGKLDDTYVFFTSDNGTEQGEHRITFGKNHPYEESIRVPLVVRGPGIAPNTTSGELVVNVDLAATIAELAGVTPPYPTDGRSLVPLLHGAAPAWRSEFLIEHNPQAREGTFAGLRTRDYVYIERDYDADEVADETELYSLKPDGCRSTGDPDQLESQHANACYADLVSRLHGRLRALRACAGAGCF